MKKLLLMALLVFCGYKGWEKYQAARPLTPLMDEPYVAVYGRDSCGVTQQALRDLSTAGVNVKYYIIDDKTIADLIHSRMEASNISTRRYNLPVVDVNGKIAVRPNVNDVIANYNDRR